MEKLKNKKLVREVLRKLNRRLGVLKTDPYGLGLSLSQSSALVDLERAGTLKAQDLVFLLNMEKSSISRLLGVLATKKLIQVSPDPQDGRGKILSLTRSGVKAVETINSTVDRSVENLLSPLDRNEEKILAQAFRVLHRALDFSE